MKSSVEVGGRMRVKAALLSAGTLLVIANLCLPATAALSGQNYTVFRIGNFNRSSMEFAGGSPNKPVNFVVGKSDPAKDWYATQPVATASGSADKNVVNGSAPWAIHFSLKNTPASSYRLHVALLIESSRVPALRVVINGKDGMFYLHPKLDRSTGDQAGASFTIYSHADVQFTFPGRYLHPGDNVIALQAVENSDTPIPDASLTYDAMELDSGLGSFHSEVSSAQILPTIFYQQQKNELEEIVDVFVAIMDR